jgi:hypothetical protein
LHDLYPYQQSSLKTLLKTKEKRTGEEVFNTIQAARDRISGLKRKVPPIHPTRSSRLLRTNQLIQSCPNSNGSMIAGATPTLSILLIYRQLVIKSQIPTADPQRYARVGDRSYL